MTVFFPSDFSKSRIQLIKKKNVTSGETKMDNYNNNIIIL